MKASLLLKSLAEIIANHPECLNQEIKIIISDHKGKTLLQTFHANELSIDRDKHIHINGYLE